MTDYLLKPQFEHTGM